MEVLSVAASTLRSAYSVRLTSISVTGLAPPAGYSSA